MQKKKLEESITYGTIHAQEETKKLLKHN